jgi:hypothetical protein
MFLLLALGLKGGYEIQRTEDLSGLGAVLGIGLTSCLVIPSIIFILFRKKLGLADASAIAACLGSVSAVTFVAAQGVLDGKEIQYSPYMVAIMALMEVPAIIVALGLFESFKLENQAPDTKGTLMRFVSVLSCKSVILLLGGFLIGLTMNEKTWLSLKPMMQDSFRGLLAFFLMDLGVQAQRRFAGVWAVRGIAFLIAVVCPLCFGAIASVLGGQLGLPDGDQVLLSVLVGSASYIAAPSAVRASIPEANPGLFAALPIAVTFPMNILIGIPFYLVIAQML